MEPIQEILHAGVVVEVDVGVWMAVLSQELSHAERSRTVTRPDEHDVTKLEETDEQTGVEIVRRAIEEPMRLIVQNAGAEGSIVVEKVRASKDDAFGYNALTDTFENLVSAGVIDPTKVARTALQNAASIAGLLLTTEVIVVEKKEERTAAAAGPPGGGMGGMY